MKGMQWIRHQEKSVRRVAAEQRDWFGFGLNKGNMHYMNETM